MNFTLHWIFFIKYVATWSFNMNSFNNKYMIQYVRSCFPSLYSLDYIWSIMNYDWVLIASCIICVTFTISVSKYIYLTSLYAWTLISIYISMTFCKELCLYQARSRLYKIYKMISVWSVSSIRKRIGVLLGHLS
jgi:hypothetical protein